MADSLPFGHDNTPRYPFRAEAVTPSDLAADNFTTPRTIYVGGAGVVAVIPWLPVGATVANFTVPAGGTVPVSVRRVNSTNTTATLLQSVW